MRNKFLGTGDPGYHPLRKVRVFAAGLRYAVLHDFAVAYKVAIALVVLVFSFIYRDWLDFIVLVLATGLMVAAEVFNSAIEAMCDYVQFEIDEKIRVIKDMSAAATAIAIMTWWIVLLHELFSLLGRV